MMYGKLQPIEGVDGREPTAFTKKTIAELLAEEGVDPSEVYFAPKATPEPQPLPRPEPVAVPEPPFEACEEPQIDDILEALEAKGVEVADTAPPKSLFKRLLGR